MAKIIRIRVHSGGKIEAHAEGFDGPVCEKEIGKLLAGLGTVVEEGHTLEFFAGDQTHVKVGGGA